MTAEGIDINYLNFSIEEIFHRFALDREWEVSELSLGKFIAQVAGDRPDITGLPVFPSRMFRHSSIYLHRDGGITAPEQLAGKKVGVPEWVFYLMVIFMVVAIGTVMTPKEPSA